MNNGSNPGLWRRPALFVALTAFAALAALPAGPAAAHGAGNDTVDDIAFGCELGSPVEYPNNCFFDINNDGTYDWWVTDTDGDLILDTSSLDTDYNGDAETYYRLSAGVYGDVIVRYDHDEDGLYDDVEVNTYSTDPYYWDTDGDGFGDYAEIVEGSAPLDPYCNPHGCG